MKNEWNLSYFRKSGKVLPGFKRDANDGHFVRGHLLLAQNHRLFLIVTSVTDTALSLFRVLLQLTEGPPLKRENILQG